MTPSSTSSSGLPDAKINRPPAMVHGPVTAQIWAEEVVEEDRAKSSGRGPSGSCPAGSCPQHR